MKHIFKNKLWVWVVSLTIMASCGVILEVDISSDEVKVLAPGEGAEIFSEEIQFKWEELKGASEYEIVVVSPDFDQPATVALDSVVGEVTFLEIALEPGDYQWQITALNEGYRSTGVIRSFQVMDSSFYFDLSEYELVLNAPSSGTVFAESRVTLSWTQLDKARKYHIGDGIS
ncbi:hypothetical protein [Reichenbachiella ulvae]|uniref:Uncharacterized protein n=1 Tax=Reichenbachiella ulvae TaxID=2980104 RepID=A0ABT3CV52_9BACT|nr:hypothetical protein [Reichenbachiella ulvae]MCV9387451.1 hypothetical protein [Reichenbachiella ulvae]